MLPLLAISAALAAPPDISGVYRLELTVASRADVPVLGEADIVAHTTMLATVTPDGSGGYTQRHTTCRIQPESTLRIGQTRIPRSFVAPMPDKTYPLALSMAPDGRWQYAADFGAQHIGYDPTRAGGQPPDTDSHPAVLDWEGDGKPGATIFLEVPVFGQVEVYITQLAHTRVSGHLTEDGAAGGVQIVALHQRSIGAQPSVFAANPNVTQLPGQSRFSLTRIPDGSTCADL